MGDDACINFSGLGQVHCYQIIDLSELRYLRYSPDLPLVAGARALHTRIVHCPGLLWASGEIQAERAGVYGMWGYGIGEMGKDAIRNILLLSDYCIKNVFF